MATNSEIIRKADMALADLATAGRLNPEQTDRFLRNVIDSPTMLRRCRVVAMNGPEKKINKIGFGSRIMRPAVSATPLAAADRVKPDLGQVTLTTKEVQAVVYLPYDVLEDNIEGGNVKAGPTNPAGGLHGTIVDLISERAALDLEELCLLGDTGSADPYLAQFNGWLKRATANNVNAAGAISKTVLKNGIRAMPTRYLRNRGSLVHFLSVNNETELRDQYSVRTTALGDQALQTENRIWLHGTPVESAALMPGANGLFGDPLNLLFGIQRDLQIEYDKDIEARVFKIVLTTRVGVEIEEVNALVKYTGITGG